MKTLNFWRTLLFTVMAAAAFTACSNDDSDDSGKDKVPSITVNGNPTANVGVTLEGIDKTEAITVKSSGVWTLTYSAGADAWVTASTVKGDPGTSLLTFKIAAGTEAREATVTLTTIGSVSGYPFPKSATITIKQSEGGSSGEAIYSNNFDVSKVEKNSEGKWPFLDQTEVWKNAAGTGNSTVTYASTNVSVRSSGKLSGGYEGSSAVNKIFFGTAPATFSIDKITLPAGATKFRLVFGGAYSVMVGQDYDNIFKPASFVVTLGNGTVWSGSVTYTKIGGDDTVDPFWVRFAADFTLAAAIPELSVKFTANLPSGFAIDDVVLTEGNGGQAIEFGEEPGPGETTPITIPDLISGMPTEQTIIDAVNDRVFEAVVVTDKAGGNFNKNTLMVMTPGATTAGNGIALFGSGPFTNPEDAAYNLQKGDKIKVTLKAGKARRVNFQGLYEITGDAAGGWIEVEKINSGNAITPVTIAVADLAAFQGMVVKVANAAAPATAAIWCAADKFGVHSFSVGGTAMNVFCQANMPGFVGREFVANATGTITGFSFVKSNAAQICPQTTADVAAFAGAPSTEPIITSVNPTALSFVAAGETKSVTVTTENATGCTLAVTSDNAQFTPTANGVASVSVAAAANAGTAIAGTLTIKLMKDGAVKSTKTVTLSQAAAGAPGEKTTTIVMKEVPAFAAVGTGTIVATTVAATPFTLTFAKSTGSTAPTYYGTATFEALRMYAANTMEVTGATITKIVFTYTAPTGSPLQVFNNMQTTTGTIVVDSDTAQTWTGSASNIVFNCNPGKDANNKNFQSRISSMTITYTE